MPGARWREGCYPGGVLERRRSFTSDLVAALRALYSEVPLPLEVAGDPVARGLLDGPLGAFLDTVRGVPGGPFLAHRAIGELTLGLSYGVPLRTAAIDAGLRRRLGEGVRQLVVLGAGLDARAWRLPELKDAHVYELDHPNTQAFKRRAVGTLPPLAAKLSWCPIDFERQTVPEVLAESDFDPSAPSLWVWEGVTMYLTPEAISACLEAVAQLTAAGSQLQITYLPPDYGPAPLRPGPILDH